MLFFSKRDLKNISDSVLVKSYRQTKSNEYMSEIFERYYHLVYGICLKYLNNRDYAKDAVIQIFEKLIIDLPNHEISNFSSWLHSVSRNHCLMTIRKHKQKLKNEEGYKAEMWLVADENEMEDIRIKETRLNLLKEAVEELNPQQRECIKLFYFEQKCYKEIELITGYPLKKVKSYIQNGKRNLSQNLLEKDEVAV